MFIHSSISEHLAYFHLLAVVTNAAKNIVICICFSLCFQFWDILIYLSVELLAFVFNFFEVSHTVLHRACHFTFPPAMPKRSNFLHSHQHLLPFLFLSCFPRESGKCLNETCCTFAAPEVLSCHFRFHGLVQKPVLVFLVSFFYLLSEFVI